MRDDTQSYLLGDPAEKRATSGASRFRARFGWGYAIVIVVLVLLTVADNVLVVVLFDEYTEKYMEDNPDQFPEASMDKIILKIKKLSKNYPSLQDYACDLLKKLDKNDDGVIDFQEFTTGLRS